MAALALGGCSQTGQPAMQASFAPDAGASPDGATIGQDSEKQAVSVNPTGLAAFFAPRPTQVAEVVENIPGDFQAPENPPLPPSRPDFGDRVQTASAPTGQEAQPVDAAPARADAPQPPPPRSRARKPRLSAPTSSRRRACRCPRAD